MDNQINRILEKIKFLNIDLEPTLNLDIIKEYEKEFYIKFPETYVKYLTRIQNGRASRKSLFSKNGPYYGIYSFENSMKENNEWKIDINVEFKLIEDMEIDADNDIFLDSYINGTIPICEYGCGEFFRLIVNGNKNGEVIAISLEDNADGELYLSGIYFMNVDILTFYENWLDRRIRYNDKLINAYYSFLEFGKNNKYKVI